MEIVDRWNLENRKSGYGGDTGASTTPQQPPGMGRTAREEAARFKNSPGTTAANAKKAMLHPDVSVKERRYLKGVMALAGMSRGAMGAVLAHEYGGTVYKLISVETSSLKAPGFNA
jgi:hypothetical protein